MAVVGFLILLVGAVDWVTTVRISLSIFYLIPVALATLWLGMRWGVAAAISSVSLRLLGDFLAHEQSFAPVWITWNGVVSLCVFLVVIGILDALNSLYGQLEQRVVERTRELHESVEARKRVERELRDVGSRERESIGRELHDDLCQHLVGTAFAAKVLGEQLVASPAAPAVASIVLLIEEGIAKTRDLARGLLLANLDPAHLEEELEELASKASGDGITCRYRRSGNPQVEDSATAAQLFRIAQEGVRNALRHAKPGSLEIELAESVDGLTLTIGDDGVGLPPESERGTGMGLRIMAHRATVIGGEIAIETAQPRGTRIVCRVPSRSTRPDIRP